MTDQKVAIVTAGGSGMGAAVARRLARDGFHVAILSSSGKGEALAKELDGIGVTGSNQSNEDLKRLVDETMTKWGRIDALVNSAGITGPNTRLWDYPVDAWRQVMEVNLTGLFICCREVVGQMRSQGWGRIVNIASVAGKDGNPNASAYSASKAAVIGLTKSLGKELADTGIRVNCITPAAVKTAIFDQISEQHIQFMLSKIPMGRFGQPEEIAAMVAWLCTEDCSFTTGAVFDLSGGRSTY
jgi:2-dehydro-3-deoxy-L-rhamnonate dehydrogenase (NAD+)